MEDYSFYTSQDFLLDEKFIYWFYTGEGDYYQKIADTYPDRLFYLQEAMNMLDRVRWVKPTIQNSEIDEACRELMQVIKDQEAQQNKSRIRKMYIRVASVAAALIVIISSVSLLKIYNSGEVVPGNFLSQLLETNDSLFTAGKNCLFVDNHLEKVFVDETSLDYQGLSMKEGMNKLTVSYGKRAQLTLSDGTKIWANSGTVLLYPSQFSENTREVYVDGEIYIDVVANPEKPFLIKTRDVAVKVLGTSFNVTAYRDETEKSITLVSGKVQITTSDGRQVDMLPNKRFTQSEKGYQIDEVKAVDYTSWKDGQLVFKKTDLAVILRKLSRHYNVDISYGDLSGISCSGKLNLDEDIDAVLKTVAETAPITIKKQQQQYSIHINGIAYEK